MSFGTLVPRHILLCRSIDTLPTVWTAYRAAPGWLEPPPLYQSEQGCTILQSMVGHSVRVSWLYDGYFARLAAVPQFAARYPMLLTHYPHLVGQVYGRNIRSNATESELIECVAPSGFVKTREMLEWRLPRAEQYETRYLSADVALHITELAKGGYHKTANDIEGVLVEFEPSDSLDQGYRWDERRLRDGRAVLVLNNEFILNRQLF